MNVIADENSGYLSACLGNYAHTRALKEGDSRNRIW